MNFHHVLKRHYLTNQALSEKLIQKGRVVSLPKGKFLFFQEQMADFVAIPLDGELGFYPAIDEGITLIYNLITPGIIINDVPFILGGGSQADIQAVTDCTVLLLPFSAFEQLMGTCCEFSKMLNLSLARKQRFCLTLFQLRGEKNIQRKIDMARAAISVATGDGSIPLNISTLASLLNMSRNTVGRHINQALLTGQIVKSSTGYRLVENRSVAA